jgi:hypothetical protein
MAFPENKCHYHIIDYIFIAPVSGIVVVQRKKGY